MPRKRSPSRPSNEAGTSSYTFHFKIEEKEQTMHREDQFIPHLCVSDGLAALDFYKSVFGAEEGHRMMAPDEKRLMHGEIIIDGHKCFLSDQFGQDEGGTVKTPQ